jgi:hypothetical protein
LRSDAVRRALAGQIDALNEAIVRNAEAVMDVAHGVLDHLADLRDSMNRARQRIDRAAAARAEPAAPKPSSGPSPGF